MNLSAIIGRLVQVPEVKTSNSGSKVLRNSVAVRRRFKNQNGEYESDFINIVAFNATAELIASYFNKGSLIGIEGEIRTGSYKAQDGSNRYTTDVIVNNVTFVEPRKDAGTSNDYNNSVSNNNTNNQSSNGGSNDWPDTFDITDDDLPF